MPPINNQLFQHLINLGFGSEVIYSFVIIICSLMIYLGTRKIYDLSNYGGIKYFRRAFLFFAIAYFFRSFIKAGLVYFNIHEAFEFAPMIVGQLSLFLFMYFSSMAILFLLYSIMWKKWERTPAVIYLFQFIAISLSFISIIIRNPVSHFIINVALFIFVIIIVLMSRTFKPRLLSRGVLEHRKSSDFSVPENLWFSWHPKNKSNSMYTIYLLLSVFWILNILEIMIPNFLETPSLLIHLASLGTFLLILYRVLRKIGD